MKVRKWTVCAMAMLTPVAFAACGGSDQEAAGGEPATWTAPKEHTVEPDFGDPPATDARSEITEVLSDVQADFPFELGLAVCKELSERGRRELEKNGLSKEGDCANEVIALSERMRARGVRRPYYKVISVKVDSRRATALVRVPGDRARRIPFVKEDPGGWKLVSLRHAEPVDRLLDER